MGVLNKGELFTDGSTVTSARLHQLVENATFTSDAVDGNTISINSGRLSVNEITSTEIADSSITPSKVDLDNSTGFDFINLSGYRHSSTPNLWIQHNVSGALKLNLFAGNCQYINVSQSITSVDPILNPSADGGQHFTFILNYTSTGLNGPSATSWNSNWRFPSTYDGTLTMNSGSFDLISGVTLRVGEGYVYIANVIKNFVPKSS